jgi:hypothetical protein
MTGCLKCKHFDDVSGVPCGSCVAIPNRPHFELKHKKLLILGYARHGKDTVAELLRDCYGLKFESSSLFLAEAVVRPYLAQRGVNYSSLDECYADRGNHRAAWYDAICDYNEKDPAKLAREILKVADVYIGMRASRQYEASRQLFDATFWVDASGRGLSPESTTSNGLSYIPDEMIFIDNSGTLKDLQERVCAAYERLL